MFNLFLSFFNLKCLLYFSCAVLCFVLFLFSIIIFVDLYGTKNSNQYLNEVPTFNVEPRTRFSSASSGIFIIGYHVYYFRALFWRYVLI